MALTEQAFQAWLESDSAVRCTLVEVTVNILGVETILYLSNKNYNTTPTDTPANIAYLPIINTSLTYSESISLDGSPSMSYGDLELNNTNGEYDHWADYVWAGRSINIFIGDHRDIRDNFTKIYTGIVSDIDFKDRNTINISIRDILEKLNTPITATLIGGTGANASVLRPLIFGEVFNITPVLLDAATLTYMVHNGIIERIIEVRDNGVPLILNVGYTEDNTTGTFQLLRAAAGTITCSVQGEQNTVNPFTGALILGNWASTVARIIQLIITKYGDSQIVASEMDLTALEDFNAAHTTPVGIYINSNMNVISACQELAASVGAQFTSTRKGLITLLKITTPVTDAGSKSIDDNSIIQGSVSISNKVPVQAAVKLGYCRNWTTQTSLLTGIPEDNKLLFTEEYLLVGVVDNTVKTLYKLSAEPVIKNTLLLTDAEGAVTNEANRLLNLWKVPRFVYTMECTVNFLVVKLGEMVKLTHYRFGLSSAKSGQVISVSTNWDTGRVSIEVLV